MGVGPGGADDSRKLAESKIEFLVQHPNLDLTADSEMTNCPVCRKAIGLFNGKHHCRACMGAACYCCTKSRLSLYTTTEGVSKTPKLRVCDVCTGAKLRPQGVPGGYQYPTPQY